MNNAILMASGADIDIMVHGLISYEVFGQTCWITTTHVCLLIVMIILVGFFIAANRKIKHATDVPDGFQNVLELIVEMLDDMVEGVMGVNSAKFANYISTVFIFILMCNISGIFGLRPPTADYGVTFALGVMTFGLIQFNKFKYQKVKGVLKGLCDPWPIWAPINIISDLAVPVSLSLRLFANILSGTIITALVYGILGVVATFWPAILHVYFDLFSGAIQTYVFCMLTMTYISDAMTTE